MAELTEDEMREIFREDLEYERVFIMGEHLVAAVDQCTCGAGGASPHERYCGIEPIAKMEDLVFPKPTEALLALQEKELAIRMLHTKEDFGDCVEDGDPWPCKTIRVLDFTPSAEVVPDITSL